VNLARRHGGKLHPSARENGSAETKSASGRSRTSVAKAASISRLVLALRTWICRPIVRAADSKSVNVDSATAALAGLTSTATRAAPHQPTLGLVNSFTPKLALQTRAKCAKLLHFLTSSDNFAHDRILWPVRIVYARARNDAAPKQGEVKCLPPTSTCRRA
jgi:hypothetical protein